MQQSYMIFAFIMVILFSSSGCKKDDPVIPNEGELITNLDFILTPSTGGEQVTFSFEDLDGDGGLAPTITNGKLDANKIYFGQLLLTNIIPNPDINISDEILAEGEDHQFFFEISSGLDASIEYQDTDINNRPIGLSIKLVSGMASNGTIKIVLRHEPDKNAAGVVEGIIDNAGGETDIEVIFDVEIQ